MSSWARVKWTEAGQIADLLQWSALTEEEARVSPQSFFTHLRQVGRLSEAVSFLGQALPRFDAVGWSARAVRDLKSGVRSDMTEREALKAALLWLQDPTEPRRRKAREAAESAPDNAPERLAALSVFFSGGSITPPDCPPVPAPKEAAGRFAAGAVLMAAFQTNDPIKALNAVLDAGEMVAERGLEAEAP